MYDPTASTSSKQSIELAIYSTCFRLSLEAPRHKWFFYFDLLLLLLHELSFPFTLSLSRPSYFPLKGFLGVRLLWLTDGSALRALITSFSFCALVFLIYIYFTVLVKFYTKRRTSESPFLIIRKVMAYTLQWIYGPLMVPIHAMMLRCCTDPSTLDVIRVILIVITIFFSVSCILYSSAVSEWFLVSSFPQAISNTRIPVYCLIAKLISTYSVTLFPYSQSPVLAIYFLLYQILAALAYWHNLPFFLQTSNQIMIVIYAVSSFGSLLMLANMALSESTETILIVLFFIGSLCVAPVAVLTTKIRWSKINKSDTQRLSSGIEVEIKARNVLWNAFNLASAKSPIGSSFSLAIEDFESFFNQRQSCFEFKLFWASYTGVFKKKRYLGLKKLRSLLNEVSFPWDKIIVQVRLQYISHKVTSFEKTEVVLLDLVREIEAIDKVNESISVCLQDQLRFWMKLMAKQNNLNNLDKLTLLMGKDSSIALRSIKEIIRLNPKDVFFRKLYCQYLEWIDYDEDGLKEQKRLVEELSKEAVEDSMIANRDKCIFIISGEEKNIGTILEVNEATCRFFKANKAIIKGRSINEFMPKSLAAIHDFKLESYPDKKEGTIAHNKWILTKDTEGFICEAAIELYEFPNYLLTPSITFVGCISPYSQCHCCIFNAEDHLINEVSQPFFSFFKLDKKKLKENYYSFGNLVHSFAKQAEQVKKDLHTQPKVYFEDHITLEGKEYSIEVTLLQLSLVKSDPYFAKIDINSEGIRVDSEASRNEQGEVLLQYDGEYKKISTTIVKDGNSQNQQKTVSFARREFRSFQVSIICIFLLEIIFTVVNISFCYSLKGSYEKNLNLILTPVQSVLESSTYYGILLQRLLDKSLFGNLTLQQEDLDFEQIQQRINESLGELNSMQQTFASERIYVDGNKTELISDASINIENAQGAQKVMNIMDALQLYSNALDLILNRTYANLKQDPSPTYILANNSYQSLQYLWDNAANILIQQQNDILAKRSWIDVILSGMAIALISIKVFIIFLPVQINISRKKSIIYNIFEQLSPKESKKMFDECLKRLLQYQKDHFIESSSQIENIIEEASHYEYQKVEGTQYRHLKALSWKYILLNKGFKCLLLILIITIAYYLSFMLVWRSISFNMLQGTAQKIYLNQQRKTFVIKMVQETLQRNNTLGEWALNPENLRQFETGLESVESSLYYGIDVGIGNNLLNLEGASQVVMGNLCPLFIQYNLLENDGENCTSIEGGILTEGTHISIDDFIGLSQSIRYEFEKGQSVTLLQYILELRPLGVVWLPMAFSLFDTWISSAVLQVWDYILQVNLGCMFLFIICWAAWVKLIYFPVLHQLNLEVRQVVKLLCMLPPEWLTQGKASLPKHLLPHQEKIP